MPVQDSPLLPPLKLLHTFDVASRHLSVTRAAKELNLTQAAVSRQIRQLEDNLRLTLFERNSRGLELTDAGQRYFEEVSVALALIGKATTQIRPATSQAIQRLVLAVDAAFNARWLAHRLGDFCRTYSFIDIEIIVTKPLADSSVNLMQGVDAQICFGRGNWPGYEFERLMDFVEFPVCAPPKPTDKPLVGTVNNTLNNALLIHEGDHRAWRRWLEYAGLDLPYTRGPIIHDSMSCLAMATAGGGFAIGDNLTCRDALTDGSLIKPFKQERPMENSFYLLNARTKPAGQALSCFRDWLVRALI